MSYDAFGTGFLIAPDLILTAAHVIVTKNVLHKNIKFYPMLHGKISAHHESFEIIQIYFPEQYNHGADASYDFAIARLSQKVDRTKYIMIGQDYPDCSNASIYGYPLDKNNPKQHFFKQYGGNGKISHF